MTSVFEARAASSPLKRYAMLAYGIPACIVAASVAVAHDGYGRDDVCWLSTDRERLIWAFVGPVCAIILLNVLFLVGIVRVLVRIQRRRAEFHSVKPISGFASRMASIRQALKVAAKKNTKIKEPRRRAG